MSEYVLSMGALRDLRSAIFGFSLKQEAVLSPGGRYGCGLGL